MTIRLQKERNAGSYLLLVLISVSPLLVHLHSKLFEFLFLASAQSVQLLSFSLLHI